MLADAAKHHVWATHLLLDSCAALREDQLTAPATAVFGSVLDTMRHIVAADDWYLTGLTHGGYGRGRVDEGSLSLADLQQIADEDATAWEAVISQAPDPDADIATSSIDGGQRHAATGIRLAQAFHHGSEHRSQVCTVLTTLGVGPPDLSVWRYGTEAGRVHRKE